MRELIELATIERFFQALAVGAPLAGLLVGALLGAKKQNVKAGATRGLLLGLLGTANLLLWRVYNALTEANGLDSVRGLSINFGLFTFLGIAAGIVGAKRAQPKQATVPAAPTKHIPN